MKTFSSDFVELHTMHAPQYVCSCRTILFIQWFHYTLRMSTSGYGCKQFKSRRVLNAPSSSSLFTCYCHFSESNRLITYKYPCSIDNSQLVSFIYSAQCNILPDEVLSVFPPVWIEAINDVFTFRNTGPHTGAKTIKAPHNQGHCQIMEFDLEFFCSGPKSRRSLLSIT